MKLSLLACACLFTPATLAGEILVAVEGHVTQVLGNGVMFGDLAGSGVGDAVRYSVEVEVGQPTGMGEVLLNIDTDHHHLTVDGITISADPTSQIPMLVGNDVAFTGFPQVDYINASSLWEDGHVTWFLVEDPAGALLSSNDLSQNLGSFVAGAGSELLFTSPSGAHGLRISIDSFSIVEIGPVGTADCAQPLVNSSGQFGLLQGEGSAQVGANRLELQASQLPQNVFGLMLASPTVGFVASPAGSQGNLCLGGAIGRFTNQVGWTGSVGSLVVSVNLESIPTSTLPAMAMAGDTWRFQVWHRDLNPGQTTNFTNAIEVLMQ